MLAVRAGRGLLRELDRRDRDGAGLTVPIDPDVDRSTDQIAHEPPLKIADAFDRLTVELDDDVAHAEAPGRRRARLEQLDDLEATLPADPVGDGVGKRPGPADDAEERSADPAVDDERFDDGSRSGVDRHRQPESDARDGGVDPDDAPARVGQRTAGIPRVEGRIRLDDILDEPVRSAVAHAERPSERA